MNSVGKAWAVMKGRLTGDKEDAKKTLLSKGQEATRIQNNTEIRGRSWKKKKHRMGSKY